MRIKSAIRQLVPERLILLYHHFLASLAAFIYRYPSSEMIIIGITGTKGKTSAANFIWASLTRAGLKTGLIGTANIRIGKDEFLNKFHMTMPGRFKLQKILKTMVGQGCKFCVIEVTSEGIKQSRHVGILFDILVFTNLYPEHLQSHGGSFINYKKTKGELFSSLMDLKNRKIIGGRVVKKTIIINEDSPHKNYFLSFRADRKLTYGLNKEAQFSADEIKSNNGGVYFNVKGTRYHLNILGEFNVLNALPAIAVCSILAIPANLIKQGLEDLHFIPGRMEKIKEAKDFIVLVDYAHEEKSITAVLDTARKIIGDKGNVIILLGAEGGGRDKAKRPVMGKIAAKKADYVVVSNVDPYEDDPVEILEDIARSAVKYGKKRKGDLFVIEDRREGIRKAISLANKGDIVLITGKGAEQSIIIGGKRFPWDDRLVVREELKRLKGF